jgi:integral membrane protein
VKPLFLAYRVLATVVGLSIITLIVIGVPLEHLWQVFPDLWPSQLYDGAPLQRLGFHINLVLGTAHGFIYLAFLLVALALAQRTRWPIGFTIVTLLCGTIPFVSFWAELRAVRRVREQHPELAGAARTPA